MVLFTSTVGFYSDLKMARGMKERKPAIKICFVGPQVQIKPAESLLASADIDFVVRGEFDYAVVDYAKASRYPKFRTRASAKTARSSTTRRARCCRPRNWMRSRLPPTFIKRTWQLRSTTCRSCCTRSFRSTRRAAARLCARFACGRRRCRATPGAFARWNPWLANSSRRTRCSPRRRNSSSMTILSTFARIAFWRSARNSSRWASAGRAQLAATATMKR